MGLFSGIKKFFKKVWSGIKTVFSAVLKPISKFLGSDIGKAIMLGISLFSLGSAFIAGGKAFLGAEGFLTKFVKGGQAFINDLFGTKFGEQAAEQVAGAGAESAASLADQAAAQNAAQTAETATGMVKEGVGNAVEGAGQMADQGVQAAVETGQMISQGGGMKQGAVDMTKIMAEGGEIGPTIAQSQSGVPLNMIKSGADEGGHWLSKAAKAGLDFMATPGGGTVAGSVIKGIGDYYNLKDDQRFQDRIRRSFNPNNPGYQQLHNFDYSVNVPGNMGGGIMSQAANNFQRPLNLPPIVFEPQGG